MNITDVRTTVVETNYDLIFAWIYTDEKVTVFGKSFLVPGLLQGEICDGC